MKTKIKILGFIAFLFLIPTNTNAAKMALSPGSSEMVSGCTSVLNIIVNTEGSDTTAVDAFLKYNPDEVEIIDQATGISGIQIRKGSVYDSYPGNIVNNGIIRLTAFNREGYFNGRGVVGSIVFKSKPGVTSSTINFDYRPGGTVDSNVADPDSKDILNGAYGGTYTFKTGKCGGDSTPPNIQDEKPAQGEIGAALDSNVEFTIIDSMSGVDLNNLKVDINGTMYTKDGENQFTADGKPNKYKITIDPKNDFLEHVPVVVKINAQDLDKNVMPEKKYSFNELMPATECQLKPVACEPCPTEGLKSSAPEEYTGINWWPWLIILLCSLILNLRLLGKSELKEVKIKFIKKSIKKRKTKK